MGLIDFDAVGCPNCGERAGWEKDRDADVVEHGGRSSYDPSVYACNNCGHRLDIHELEYYRDQLEVEAADEATDAEE